MRRQVPFHVVHAQNRNTQGKTQGMGHRAAHHQGAHQPRACSVGNTLYI